MEDEFALDGGKMPQVLQEIDCTNCGAPLTYNPGEVVVTCKYCGQTVVLSTGEAFTLEHSIVLNTLDPNRAQDMARAWMRSGFMMPGDLAKKATFLRVELNYLPFWDVHDLAKTHYKGIFERIAPPIVKEGDIVHEYDWVVLGRKGSSFPTQDYEIPLAGKIPYDFKKIEPNAKVLNSELDEDEAKEQAKSEIESRHKFLASQDVDRIIDMTTQHDLGDAVLVHAPVWFTPYGYKGKQYELMLDGSTGQAIKGDIPQGGGLL